jgi:hypothetical protein
VEAKHHNGKTPGTPHIQHEDLFVLVTDPLSKNPKFFVGHSEQRLCATSLRHQAKKMDHATAKAWHDFLTKAGHDFFLAVHEEEPPKQKGIRILSHHGERS